MCELPPVSVWGYIDVEAGQQSLPAKDGRLKVIPVDDYNPYRWKEGLICFRNESFLSIMSDLEKYFGVSIVVENKNVLKYYFTGKFRQADGIDYALRVL